ncbi:DUF6635 family protein [Roseicyclus persicicus]|uniref:Uncharacterized protein n=1 Tax=Roseicyclus persicicus TaxID=2650661 RepID=A0A7X6GYN0_9RHOB|nr:DUF6635 family protein [Roseibacterium persicicum]NKX44810.1 hypothetical protein [Roseibacterium persicicum]
MTAPAPDMAPRARRAQVEAFVARHFRWPGSLRLHRAALGRDILRAPVNVVLSPVLVLTRLAALVARLTGARRAAAWLGGRRLLLRTAVAARVEAAVLEDLLEVPLPDGPPADAAALSRAILSAPAYAEALRRQGSPEGAAAMADRIAGALADYTATRSAVAEITTALLAVAVGAALFQTLTPGMVSMAPGVAEAVARHTAIADFPLGDRLGRLWYGVIPVGPSPGLVAATLAGLLATGAVVAAFAGALADPVLARLGVHRRRLLRLIARVEAETRGRPGAPGLAGEHLLARGFDLWDATLSILRLFRG